MSNIISLHRAAEPEASPYAPPLSFEARRAFSELDAAHARLRRLTGGNFITTSSLAQVPELLKEIGRLSIVAQKAVRT